MAFIHNHYRTDTPSGEDTAIELETKLVRDAGCEVFRYTRASDEIASFSAVKKAALAPRVVWSREDQTRLRAFFDQTRPDVVLAEHARRRELAGRTRALRTFAQVMRHRPG